MWKIETSRGKPKNRDGRPQIVGRKAKEKKKKKKEKEKEKEKKKKIDFVCLCVDLLITLW